MSLATLEFNLPEDDDDDMDADDMDAMVLALFKKTLADFLSAHPDMATISYIGVCTGYTDRILRKENAMKKLLPSVRVIYGDKYTMPSNVLYKPDSDVYNLINDISHYHKIGSVIFADSEPMKVFEYVNDLSAINYCAFCKISCIYSMAWYKLPNGTTIMMCDVDTESG